MNKTKKAEKLLKDIMVDINNYFAEVKNLDPVEDFYIPHKTQDINRKEIKEYTKKEATCKYCGDSGFAWAKTKWGWRMFDQQGEQHMCKSNGNNGDSTG